MTRSSGPSLVALCIGAALLAVAVAGPAPGGPLADERKGRAFVSKSFGCYLSHPVYGVDLAAVCKK